MIVLIGASTANLYAGKLLKERGYSCTIFESKSDFKNEQIRQLRPQSF